MELRCSSLNYYRITPYRYRYAEYSLTIRYSFHQELY